MLALAARVRARTQRRAIRGGARTWLHPRRLLAPWRRRAGALLLRPGRAAALLAGRLTWAGCCGACPRGRRRRSGRRHATSCGRRSRRSGEQRGSLDTRMGEQAQRTREEGGRGREFISASHLDGLFTPAAPRQGSGFTAQRSRRAGGRAGFTSRALRGVRRDQQEWEGHAVGAARLDAGDG